MLIPSSLCTVIVVFYCIAHATTNTCTLETGEPNVYILIDGLLSLVAYIKRTSQLQDSVKGL